MTKITMFLLSIFFVFSMISCDLQESSNPQIATIKASSLELVEIEAKALLEGVYDATLEKVNTKVVVQDNILRWIAPDIESGDYILTIDTGNETQEVDVLIENKNLVKTPKNYLLDVIEELPIQITSQEIQAMSLEQQQIYARFIRSNYDYINSKVANHKETKSAIVNRKIAVGESFSFTVLSKQKWNGSGIHATQGEIYKITASGIWTDWFIDTDAEGYNKWYLGLAGFLKRAPQEDWFKLIASVDRKGKYPIGSSGQIVVAEDGDLEFFANDVMGFYWNNKGSIQVSVTRIK